MKERQAGEAPPGGEWEDGRAERLSAEIARLRARAIRYGFAMTAEALRLAGEMTEIDDEELDAPAAEEQPGAEPRATHGRRRGTA